MNTSLMPPEQHARFIYSYVLGYLARAGWKREEKGSGWWWSESEPELITMGEALDKQLLADGVDLRVEPGGPSGR